MSSAAALRLQIETALSARIPGALTPRPQVFRDLAATGVAALDGVLGGGLPVGAITEFVGSQCSGRTTLALALMAEMTQATKTVAWVDTSDALDPASAAAAGVDLARQLWIRCGQDKSSATTEARNGATRGGAAYVRDGAPAPAVSGGCGSPHPRGEVRGLSEAVDAFLQPAVFAGAVPGHGGAAPRRNRMIGTPSAPNRKLLDRIPQDARPLSRRARDREEQIPTDRQPSRRQLVQQERHAQAEATHAEAKHLATAQIAHTAAVAASRTQGGTWQDNRNNAAGRCFATAPNAIAAGLPRFRELAAETCQDGTSRRAAAPLCLPDDAKETQSDVSKGGPETSLAGEPPRSASRRTSPLWQAMEQALRSTDLLLAAGGFSAIVLDLGSVPAEYVWRIPLATWFRFRSAADRARTVLLLLTQHACARSSAELVLRLSPADAQHANTVMTGAQFRVVVERQRFEAPPVAQPQTGLPHGLHLVSPRKQPQRERAAVWRRTATWTGTETAQTREVPK